MYAINIDENKRILRITFEEFSDADSILVEKRPEDLVPEDASAKEKDCTNYLYVDGEYVYNPLPDPEPPQPAGEGITADEMAAAIMEGVNEA